MKSRPENITGKNNQKSGQNKKSAARKSWGWKIGCWFAALLCLIFVTFFKSPWHHFPNYDYEYDWQICVFIYS